MSDSDPLQDPYMDTGRCVDRLFREYLKHPKLIIASDFDSTLFDVHGAGHTFPAVISLLKECAALGFYIVVFTASADSRWPEIRAEMDRLGIPVSAINTNPIPLPYGHQGKIFYNLLIDDRCGLLQAFDILRLTISRIRHHRATQVAHQAAEEYHQLKTATSASS
jgi:hypothetical protein